MAKINLLTRMAHLPRDVVPGYNGDARCDILQSDHA
jgi:hypothetical protein